MSDESGGGETGTLKDRKQHKEGDEKCFSRASISGKIERGRNVQRDEQKKKKKKNQRKECLLGGNWCFHPGAVHFKNKGAQNAVGKV